MRNAQKLEKAGLANLVSQKGIVIPRIGRFAEGPEDILIQDAGIENLLSIHQSLLSLGPDSPPNWDKPHGSEMPD